MNCLQAMKRFFQPVAKEGASKKMAISDKEDGDEGDKRGPRKFLTWNANSLLLRVKNDWTEFSKFVQALDPDAICLQVQINQ